VPTWAERSRAALAQLRPTGDRFRRDGDVWTLGFADVTVHLRDGKGLHDLAALLAVPGTPVHVFTLLGREAPATGADPVLDEPARSAYRARLAELDAELDEARAWQDLGRAERVEAERAALVRELGAATGLGGRRRRLGDETERARKTVTARIRDALERIERAHPPLGAHLRAAVSTGTCRMSIVPPSRPDGRSETRGYWRRERACERTIQHSSVANAADERQRGGYVSVSLGMPALSSPVPAPTLASRRQTRQLQVGPVGVGSEHPISVQSMTTTLTADVNATLQQIAELTAAGCDIVRVACPSQDDADALPAIARKSQIPVIADIHFQPKYVFAAIEAGCAAVRVNPGNIRKFDDQVKQIAAAARDHGTPIRIGVNAGSLDKRLLEKHGKATPEALVESALWEASLFAEHDFYDVKISVKHHDPVVMVRAYELLAESCDYPLHLGVTEAGPAFQGTIKSAVAFGALLSKGIGDTIRVSLSAPPVEEVKVGIQILQSLNLKERKLEIVSCPSCGRAQVDVYKLADEVTAGLTGMEVPLRVAVMGCVVNGPGEAREADLGVASGNGKGQIFVKGEVVKTVPEHAIVETLIEEAMRLAEGMNEGGRPQVTVG
jgi:(E)-4-hydroxy-3-methylbut-2-enyl-diphosphate synthase